MIILKAKDLQWITEVKDDPDDQCAHGMIDFRIDDYSFVTPDDGILSVSAAALFLLRSLSSNHDENNPVAEDSQLFPHCGHCVWPGDGRYNVSIVGCSNGIDVEIFHEGDSINFTSEDGTQIKVPIRDWIAAVFSFTDQVEEFYRSCSPKNAPPDDFDQEGWRRFWEEWNVRRNTNYEKM